MPILTPGTPVNSNPGGVGTVINPQSIATNSDGSTMADSANPAMINPNPAMPGATVPVPTTVSTATAGPTTPITLPTPTVDTTNHNGTVASGNAQIDSVNQSIISAAKASGASPDSIAALINSLSPTPPDSGAAYDTATGTTEASRKQAVTDATTASNAARSAVTAAQAELAGYQAQIKAVTDQRDADSLKLENTINANSTGIGGAGSMATGSFLNVRQQEINRQAAIAALPLQALAQAAQAKVLGLQGMASDAAATLKSAQDKFDQAFQLKIDNNNKVYDAQAANRKAVFDFLTTAQKTQAANTEKVQTANKDQLNSFITDVRTSANSIGDPQAIAKVLGVPTPDPTSATFQADLQKYKDNVQGILTAATPKKTGSAGAAGSVEEFRSLYGRDPNTLSELNSFTASRKAADTTTPANDPAVVQHNFSTAKQFIADNPNASTADLKAALLQNLPKMSVTQIDALLATRQAPALTPDKAETEITNVLSAQKDAYTRDEAQAQAEAQLKTELGIKTGNLPQAFQNSVNKALDQVYGVKKNFFGL